MIVVHVTVTTAPDYVSRRAPHRQAHVERLLRLRDAGAFVGGGPAPDGRTVELVYRLRRPDDLRLLVEEDPYHVAGAWPAYCARSFARFVEPWTPVPVVLDGSRPVTLVEGPSTDAEMAQLALVELRGAGRLAFGGAFEDGPTLAVLRSADPEVAVGWLAETGIWERAALSARPLLHVL